MTNSNYGESATIKHEPEVGDVYLDGVVDVLYLVFDEHYYEPNLFWCYKINKKNPEEGIEGLFVDKEELKDFTYLGKAKNPITSIFEVE